MKSDNKLNSKKELINFKSNQDLNSDLTDKINYDYLDNSYLNKLSNSFIYRKANNKDLKNILALFRETTGRKNPSYMPNKDIIENYPSIVAYNSLKKKEIIGFVYSTPFSPDILQLTNILVKPEYRGELGSHLLRLFEIQAKTENWNSIILVNSTNYKTKEGIKRDATGFYSKNNYSLIKDSSESKIWFKQF